MKAAGNTILITGGGSGIGFALAQRFLAAGNRVIVTDRSEQNLRCVREQAPELHTILSDLGARDQRDALVRRVRTEFPDLNALINNAGIQRRIDLTGELSWDDIAPEIEINLAGQIHLTTALLPDLVRQDEARVINISSSLALVPLARMPIYCATKAAMHAFSLALRFQFRDTSLQVLEVLPPPVRTNLGGSHNFGEHLGEFADTVVAQLIRDEIEITMGRGVQLLEVERNGPGKLFTPINLEFEKMAAAMQAGH